MKPEIIDLPEYQVAGTISPDDEMYVPGQDSHYFSVGHSAIENIQVGIFAAGLKTPKNILDMACGHGRVLRALKAFFTHARITACDINSRAVDFCEAELGVDDKVYGDADFGQVKLSGKFDLIWCGSLLTHLDKEAWQALMKLCAGHLSNDGVLVFTTHGRYSVEMIQAYDFYYGLERTQAHNVVNTYKNEGFGYCNYAGKENYGISIASPSWVYNFIVKYSNLQICSTVEMGWDHHQDVYACCFMKDRVHQEIEDYSGKITDAIKVQLSKMDIEFDSGPHLSEVSARLVEKRINADNMPFGPRVRYLLVRKIVDEIQIGAHK